MDSLMELGSPVLHNLQAELNTGAQTESVGPGLYSCVLWSLSFCVMFVFIFYMWGQNRFQSYKL